ncbi:fructose-6-phosphate aldolase [Candidatus Dependentiae bacterium]|nr:fructose-6-phosphate aldolase [Candidatus Dependentiae bacterium]
MRLFLDTADVQSIKKYIDTGLIDGVTTNPSLLAKAGSDPKKQITEIVTLLPDGEISVEVTEKSPEAVYKQAKVIAGLAHNIVVKIPCHIDYYSIINRLAKEGIKLNITLVFTLVQGLMMCKLGVHCISPFLGRLDDIDVDGASLLHEMRQIIDEYGFATQILAASIRHVRHFHDSIMAGADIATLPISVFEKAATHVLTHQGIQLFDADWKKLGIKQFP